MAIMRVDTQSPIKTYTKVRQVLFKTQGNDLCDWIAGCLAIYGELHAAEHIQLCLALDVKHALYGRGLCCKT